MWSEITPEEQGEIKDDLVKAGLIEKSDTIVGDPSIDELEEDQIDAFVAKLEAKHVKNPCRTACKTAYDIARNACNLHPRSKKRKKCRNAAMNAYQLCLYACGE
ncbi:hypothetical protein [Pleomorphovibrio marinus]|uniref:hypothetical protein n=1 Tax=Pleomorphovibrio marinus TaxID=2164132 RepID=UPI000E0ACB0D|nr:hypothetical protein [Pleomorphovibrio marinus]